MEFMQIMSDQTVVALIPFDCCMDVENNGLAVRISLLFTTKAEIEVFPVWRPP